MPEPKSVEQRLDAQARAIRELRAEVKRQAALIDTLVSGNLPIRDSDSRSVSVEPAGEPGVWFDTGRCLMCGKPRGRGPKYMTCRPCGSQRQAEINNGTLQPVPACRNCGTPKTSTTLLCRPCSKSRSSQT